MELLQLRYFCVLAECESVTQAAETLRVSQPSLSKTLKSLEQELGARLFDRVGKYIQINPIGKLFFQNISSCLCILDDTTQQISDMADVVTGQVNLLINAASAFLPDMYAGFHRMYPYIKLLLSNFVRSEYRVQDYDFIISEAGSYPLHSKLVCTPLLTERMVIAVHAEHPFAGRDVVDLSEADRMPFIASNRKEEIENLCRQAGFKPNIAIQSDNGNTYVWLLRKNAGITILPEISLGSILPPEIVCVPFVNPTKERTVGIYWDPERYMSKAAALLQDYCINYFKDIFRDITGLSGKELRRRAVNPNKWHNISPFKPLQ
jgi:DNA-binding transcriptional LysR family regulator